MNNFVYENEYNGRRHSYDHTGYRTQEVKHRPYARSFSHNNKTTEITIYEPYFTQLATKVKTIEGRINSGQFKRIQAGQTIVFRNGEKTVKCKVLAKRIYSSFAKMLEKEGVSKCLPSAKSLEAGIAIYQNLPNYPERARQNGVVALEIMVIDQKTVRQSAPKEEKKETVAPARKRTRDQLEQNQAAEDTKPGKLAKEPERKRRRLQQSAPNQTTTGK